ncbi:hypothetical protein Scep_015909 [Stephania cephalantha]|uniref:Mur ligase C-terminal domain-containing protein n=1 Tax=Stephania cephalantha TaxID=152367 RepID=A0AAP0ILL4_9MAGN
MRSELETAQNGIRIINDVYNANPTSTTAGISSLKAIDCSGRRVAILGDMLELGPTVIKAHETVLNQCFDARIALIALVGKRFLAAAENVNIAGNANVICSLDVNSLAQQITSILRSTDVVLVKGSRGMQMERIVDGIKST